ncbi:hypothetical protein DFQ26_008701 [Actinomortierella ambigua]|nr:hypothetical protein DFQ26_008701 [Actinomortierella ambigua]
MVNDRSASAQMRKNTRAEEWLKNAVKDKHVRLIPFSEISKVKYNVAKGGSGTIHLGAWRNMHIAIKEQHNTNDLIKELKMHKQVHDSNYIVKFFGITKHPLTQDTCIVMQFAENGCLQDYLETHNVSIPWLTKYRLAWEVSSGLDFIHRENIFHTDLHSRNILIDTDGKALITDFGLSKSVNKTIYTTKAGLFGVVPYVAPERMQNPGETYTAKCDIYSLGVIFWELSSCVIPFEDQLQDVMLAFKIIAGAREKTVVGTAVEYEMLYRRCWDGLPQNRPTMEIVLSELVEMLAAEQRNPRLAPPRPRSPKPSRPLSSDSLIAPSTPFPYDNESQSSPENTNHVRPESPVVPNARLPPRQQSIAQIAEAVQGIPSVPSLPEPTRTGMRVSFIDNLEPGKEKAGKESPSGANNNNNAVPAAPASTAKNNRDNESKPKEDSNTDPSLNHLNNNNNNTATGNNDSNNSNNDNANITVAPNAIPPQEPRVPGLPETASLALASGLSMDKVVNKLKPNAKTIATISPPPPGAPPPPPSQPPHNARPVSPPRQRAPAGPTRFSRAMIPPPPTGAPPVKVSPTMGPLVRPPPGPPPVQTAVGATNSPSSPSSPAPPSTPSPAAAAAAAANGTTVPNALPNGPGLGPNLPAMTPPKASAPPSRQAPDYTPSTTYTPSSSSKTQPPKKQGSFTEARGQASPLSLPSESRPTPVRQIMGFNVATPLAPIWNKRPTPPAAEAKESSTGTGGAGGASAGAAPRAPQQIQPPPASQRDQQRPLSYLTLEVGSTEDSLMDAIISQVTMGHSGSPSTTPSPSMSPSPAPSSSGAAAAGGGGNHIVQPHKIAQAMMGGAGGGGGPSTERSRANTPDPYRQDADLSGLAGKSSRRIDIAPSSGGGGASSPAMNALDATTSAAATRRPSPELSPMLCGQSAQGFPVVNAPLAPLISRNAQKEAHKNQESMQRADTNGAAISPRSTSEDSEGDELRSITESKGSLRSGVEGNTKNKVQVDNFYSLVDPYKDLHLSEQSDFFTAVTNSDFDLVERMLGLIPSLVNETNTFWPYPTPIVMAARSRLPMETMKLLKKYGAILDKGDRNLSTVLHYVCEKYPEPMEAVLFLATSGADCNAVDNKKRTPLMSLLQNTHIQQTRTMLDAIRVLFKYGAHARAVDHQNKTVLHYAIQHCREPTPVMELLLKRGAEVNARDASKSTPLHLVLERMDNEELVQLLLLYGADPGLKNGGKRNALCIAAEHLRVMSAWFLLENDLLSSSPDNIKKATEFCSKADGPDKSAKPLFKNLLSDWQGKEGKIRRIQLAQDCIMRVQRTPDMKTIDQTQVALEFLEHAGVPLYPSGSSSTTNGGAGAGPGANGVIDGSSKAGGVYMGDGVSGGGNAGGGGNTGGGGGFLSKSGRGNNNNHHHHHHHNHNNSLNGTGHHHHHHHHQYRPTNNGAVQELRVAEGVEPLKQIMVPVKTAQQMGKEQQEAASRIAFIQKNNGIW